MRELLPEKNDPLYGKGIYFVQESERGCPLHGAQLFVSYEEEKWAEKQGHLEEFWKSKREKINKMFYESSQLLGTNKRKIKNYE